MEFRQLIQERRSIRRYRKCPGIREELEAILREASLAPTWKNSQTARCYVVEDEETMNAFRQAALPERNQNNCAEASALIVTTFVKNISGFNNEEQANEPGNEWGAYDLGLHDAYLILSAKDHGFDTLIMGLRDGEKIREFLDIPEEEEIMAVIALGKRDQEPSARPRKDISETAKFF